MCDHRRQTGCEESSPQGSTAQQVVLRGANIVETSAGRLLTQIAALKATYRQALTELPDQAEELARRISALELAQAMVEVYPASGPLDYAALRAKLYAKSPEEAAIAEMIGLFRPEGASESTG